MLSDTKIESIVKASKAMIDIAFDPICFVNLQKKIIYFNQKMKILLGQSHTELRNMPILCELLKIEKCPKECPLDQVLNSGKSMIVEEDQQAYIQNQARTIHYSVTPLYDESMMIGALLQIRDMTDYSTLKIKYRTLMETTAIIFSQADDLRAMQDKVSQVHSDQPKVKD